MNNQHQKTVLFVAPYFPPHGGGLEQYALEMAVRLRDDHGWRVVVATSGEGPHDTKDIVEGLTVYRLAYGLKISNTPFGIGWYRKIWRIVRKESPDMVNVHTPVPGIGEVAALAARKIPLVVTYHANSMRKGKLIADLLVRAYELGPMRLLLRKAQHIICSSDSVRTDFLRAYMHKSTTVDPGVDSEKFAPRLEAAHRTGVTLLFVAGLGHAETHKGFDKLLEAFSILKRQHEALRLVVVGDGAKRAEYEALVKSTQFADSITFAGRLQDEVLARAYQQADVFVLPTSNDSSPMVIKEAMASGLPIVSTTIGGIPDMVEDSKTGFLVEPENTAGLEKRLEVLITDEKMRREFGARGCEKALREFQWEDRIAVYDSILSGALDSCRPLLVHIAAYYPPHVGGLERVAEDFAKMLSSRGERVLVLTSSIGAKSGTEVLGGLTVRRLKSFEFAHTPVAPTLAYHLARLPRGSIVHLHLSQAYWPELVFFILWLRKIPYVIHFHLDVGPSGVLGPLFLVYKKVLWGPLLRHAEKVIVLTEPQADLLAQKYGVERARIAYIPNGVTLPVRIPRHVMDKHLKLLYVGRLARQKRVERLIRAMSLVTVPASLTIVGDGEDRVMLECLAEKIGARVSFVGYKAEQAVREMYQTHDVLLISSEREGMPLVVLEAMASGLPVVGSRVIGIQELVSGAGILVDEPYPEGFARAIESLYDDRQLLDTLSRQSYEKAAEYAWPGILSRLEGLYREIPQ